VDPTATRARHAVGVVFFMNGAVLASWIPHIPEIKAEHGLSDGSLGLVLLAMSAGAILAMPVAGAMIGRLGSRTMTTVAAMGFAIALPLPILSPTPPLLALALFTLGAANGTLDVSMNAQAVAVERRYERPIMSSFHALFSLGGLVGAAIAGGVIAAGIGRVMHVLIASGVATIAVASVVQRLLTTPPQHTHDTPTFVLPSRALLGLGSLAFLGLLAEGAMADWSAVYLHDALRTTQAVAAMGFAAFSLAMAVGRFCGDRLVGLFGPARVLRASSALAAIGLGLALLIGHPLLAVVGFGTVGFGIANIIPVLFSSAGNVPGVAAGTALAAVATTGYFGFLAGPAVIGLTAELISLPVGLALVSAACAMIAVCANVVRRNVVNGTRAPGAEAVSAVG
jgi:MFS family permease